jgi:hypothetical protein
MMRDWIKLFEEGFDSEDQESLEHEPEAIDPQEEEDRQRDEDMSAMYDRERMVTAKIYNACKQAGLEILADDRPVVYDEEDNRSAVIRVEGSITMKQLEALAGLGTNFSISNNPNPGSVGILVEFNVNQELDPTPRLKRF